MAEFVVVVGVFAICLGAMPFISKLSDVRNSAIQAARHSAWERTVWRKNKEDKSCGGSGCAGEDGAVDKNDDKLTKDVRHHFFSKKFTRNEADEEFTDENYVAEWNDARSGHRVIEKYDDITVTTTDEHSPGVVNQYSIEPVLAGIQKAVSTVTNITNFGTASYGFNLDFKGLTTAEVKAKVSSDFLNSYWHIIATQEMPDPPSVFEIKEHVTMQTGTWAGGGSNRTKNKVMGLVLVSFEDNVVVKSIRSFTKTLDDGISIFTGKQDNIKFGIDATKLASDDGLPDDRKEVTDERQITNLLFETKDPIKKKYKFVQYQFSPPVAWKFDAPIECQSFNVKGFGYIDPTAEGCKLK